MIKKLVGAAVLVMLLTANGNAQNKQIVKVDFDFSQRRLEEVNDTNYNSWTISEQKQAEKTFNNLIFKLKGNFNAKWYKVGMNAPFYSKLTSDGLATAENLELTISGLKAGQHSLLTFHNTFDKIDADGLVKVATVTKEVLQYLAEREDPLEFTGKVLKEETQTKIEQTEQKVRRVSSGTMPDFEYTGEGVKIGAVLPDSPAEKSGLLKGDIIVKFEATPIKSLTDFSNALKSKQPGDVVIIEYIREGEHRTTQLTLVER